jgi:hypothetical protein
MGHAVSSGLYAYWRALSHGGRPPERNEIEPGAIRGLLADAFVLDFNPESGFPFRICGSRINALFLKELRGAAFLPIWREADRGRIEAILKTAADEEAPYLVLGEARPAGLAPVEIEVALLPLRHQGATHARVLGSLAARSGSDWLGLIGSGPAALKSWLPMEREALGARRATSSVTAIAGLGGARASLRDGRGT